VLKHEGVGCGEKVLHLAMIIVERGQKDGGRAGQPELGRWGDNPKEKGQFRFINWKLTVEAHIDDPQKEGYADLDILVVLG